jgi:hypothetical protein
MRMLANAVECTLGWLFLIAEQLHPMSDCVPVVLLIGPVLESKRRYRSEALAGPHPIWQVNGPLAHLTHLPPLNKPSVWCKIASGSSLAKIVEQRAIKNRVQYIHCR